MKLKTWALVLFISVITVNAATLWYQYNHRSPVVIALETGIVWRMVNVLGFWPAVFLIYLPPALTFYLFYGLTETFGNRLWADRVLKTAVATLGLTILVQLCYSAYIIKMEWS